MYTHGEYFFIEVNEMKRLLAMCGCFLFCVGLCSCYSSNLQPITSYNWSLELISNLNGKILFSGAPQDDVELLELTLSFSDETFVITDYTHKQEWTGTYSLEKIDKTTSKLALAFEKAEKSVTGVYGMRIYSDGSESATIILETDDYILSFVASCP